MGIDEAGQREQALGVDDVRAWRGLADNRAVADVQVLNGGRWTSPSGSQTGGRRCSMQSSKRHVLASETGDRARQALAGPQVPRRLLVVSDSSGSPGEHQISGIEHDPL